MPVDDLRRGAAWSVDFDLPDLLAGLGMPPSGPDDDQDAVLAAEEDAIESATAEPVEVPGRVAEVLPAGPGLAIWLDGVGLRQAADADLPAILAAYRRVASWAQARELETAALIASRCAAANSRIGADETCRPVRLPPEAAAQVALALGMSQFGASAWTGLGMQLGWQLPGTAAALADGLIDLGRARLIAEATVALSDDLARLVEDRILPAAGQQTNTQLRASLRRAVIAADPEGAEQRRKDAERNARVSLHADENGTASLTGSNLPGVHAAAAWARISAMARALKGSGAQGGIDLLRANIMLGLLLGTLPLIPPPADSGSPDEPPDEGPPDGGLADDGPSGDDGPSSGDSVGAALPDSRLAEDPPAGGECDDSARDPGDGAPDPAEVGPWPDVPPPGDADAPPPEPDLGNSPWESVGWDDDDEATGPPPAWPCLPAELPAAGDLRSGPDSVRASPGRPPPGLLDVIMPWPVLAGGRSDPAVLGRIGPITRAQAWQLTALGSASAATRWRVILTDDDGCALGVEGVRFPQPADTGSRTGSATTAVVGRVSITIRASQVGELLAGGCASLPARGAYRRDRLLGAVSRAAERAADRLGVAQAADAANGGRCAHTMSSAAYRPPLRLREFVAVRDVTCRFWTCGQPAWRSDLDHTVPWQDGGITCNCDLGAVCRTHHQIKQLPGWQLEQVRPGQFCWITPAGRSYRIGPDPYPI